MDWKKVLGRAMMTLGFLLFVMGILFSKLNLMVCGIMTIIAGLQETNELAAQLAEGHNFLMHVFEDRKTCFVCGFVLGLLTMMVLSNVF